jgi:hypothetical protein
MTVVGSERYSMLHNLDHVLTVGVMGMAHVAHRALLRSHQVELALCFVFAS